MFIGHKPTSKVVLLSLLAGFALAVTGMSTTAAPARKITVCWTPPDITGVFKTATDFFEKSAADAKKHGITVEVISRSPATHVAFADQVAIIEDYIQRKCSAIAISPIEVEVVIPAIKKANVAKIPVIVVNLLEPIRGVEVASYIGFDNTVAGMISAYSLLDYYGGPGVLGEGQKVSVKPGSFLDLKWWETLYKKVDPKTANIKANVAIIEGVAGGFFSTARVNGFKKVTGPFPGIKILGVRPADWNREKGRKAAEDFLSANPKGKLDAFWAASNEMGLGAMLASEAAGRTEVKVFTNDVTPESAARIAEGRLIAETWHGFPEWGWFGTKFAVMVALGQKSKVPSLFDIRPRTVYRANALQYYPNTKLAPIDWEAIKKAAR